LQSNKQHLLFLLLLFVGVIYTQAQEDKVIPLNIKAEKDTLVAPLLTPEMVRDTSITDSLARDSVNSKKPLILGNITYKAKDYVKLSQSENKIYLYNEAELYYQDTELKAGIITVSYTHLRAHETVLDLVCRLLLEKKKK